MKSFKIGSKKRNLTAKYIITFVFGILSVLFFTNAFSIVTNINNAVQYIKQITLTSDGTTGGSLGITLDGYTSGGRIGSDLYCTKDFSKCIGVKQLVNTGDIVGFLTSGNVNSLATTTLSCSNGEIPKYNGSSRSCGTDTDKYISSISFNTTNGIVTFSGAGGLSNISINLDGRYRTGTDIIKQDTYGAYVLNGNIGLGTNSDSSAKLKINGDTKIVSDMYQYGSPVMPSQTPVGQMNQCLCDGDPAQNDCGGSWDGRIDEGEKCYDQQGPSAWTVYSRSITSDQSLFYTQYGDGFFANRVHALNVSQRSDIKLKNNLQLIQNPLEKILSLNGYTFNWKKGGTQDIGIIAQEVEKVFPQIVSTDKDGYKSVEYGNLVAPLIEAIKTLNQKIENQQKEIDILKDLLKQSNK